MTSIDVVVSLTSAACGALDKAQWSFNDVGDDGSVKFYVSGLPSGCFDLFEMNGCETLLMADEKGDGKQVALVQVGAGYAIDCTWIDGPDMYGATASGEFYFCSNQAELVEHARWIADHRRYKLINTVTMLLRQNASNLCDHVHFADLLLRGVIEFLPEEKRASVLAGMSAAIQREGRGEVLKIANVGKVNQLSKQLKVA